MSRRRNPYARVALVAAFATACGGGASMFPEIEFPEPPSEFASHPSGAVVLSLEGSIELREPAAEGEPGLRVPHVVVTRRLRALVTGEAHRSLYQWAVERDSVTRIDMARARLARADGTSAEIDALAAGHSGSGALVLSLPKPAAGDLIDIITQQTLSQVEAIPPWSFAAPAPVVESRLLVTAPEGWAVRIGVGDGANLNPGAQIQQTSESGGRQGWRMIERKVRAAPRDPSSPHAQRLAPWAAVVLASATVNGTAMRYADSWATVGARVHQLLAATMALDDSTKARVARGMGKARLREVRQVLKPSGDEGGLFDRPARPFADITAGTATAIETAAVAAAAMQGAPEKAQLALVAPFMGPVLVPQLPGFYPFRSAVLAFPGKEGWQFADPACGTCPFGKVSMELAGGRAVVFGTGKPQVVDIPLNAVEPNQPNLQFDWTLSVDGELTGTLLADLEGFVARQVYRAISYADDDATRNRLISEVLFGASSGIHVTEVDEEGELEPGQRYQLRLTIRAAAVKKGEALFELSPRLLAGSSTPWEVVEARLTDVLLPAPVRIRVTGTLRLPPEHSVTLPAPFKESMPFGKYTAAMEQQGKVITFSRRVGFFARHVPAERLNELRAFFDNVRAADATVIPVRAED